ncbi:MAG: hypothetical protein AAF431_02915 [Pseudomonadota bacterium]
MAIRVLFKALLICGLMLAIASYLGYLRTGQFWIPTFPQTISQLSVPEFDLNTTSATENRKPVEAPTEPTYKWRENGQWHYGDEPPAGAKAISIAKEKQ